jgi:hypothetical protein
MARDRLSAKRKVDQQLIRKLQDRIAELAIGNSTLRNQGAKGVAQKARALLKATELAKYRCKHKSEFAKRFADDTERVQRGLPRGAKNWGTARKTLSIFLRDVLYDDYLCEHFRLSSIVGWLELPLDRYSTDGLRAEKEGAQLPKHSTIKHMDGSLNARFQEVARKVAERLGTHPVHLDLLYFRNGKKKRNNRSHSRTTEKRVSRR